VDELMKEKPSTPMPRDYPQDLAGIQAPVLLIHGRYDRMVPFEVSIAILNHIADSRLSNCGHWPPFEKAGRVGRASARVPQGLLSGTAMGALRYFEGALAFDEVHFCLFDLSHQKQVNGKFCADCSKTGPDPRAVHAVLTHY
jgi:pimeloyl-ACP methyl ester carboxylesterase